MFRHSFDLRDNRPFWYETGNPSFLLKILRQRPTFLPELSRSMAGYELLSQFEVGNIATEALLFQTGYLTIHSTISRNGAIGEGFMCVCGKNSFCFILENQP